MIAATEDAVNLLALRIARAWQTNPARIWDDELDMPDPEAMSRIAATCAWGYFTEIIDAVKAR